METSVKKAAGACVISLVLWFVPGCGGKEKKANGENQQPAEVPYYHGPDLTPIWEADPDTLHTIGNFRFTDQSGQIITEKTFQNKIYLADFFFTTCPGICPKMTKNMQSVYEHYRGNPEVLFLSHSVTPEMDSVPVLKEYAEEKGADPAQWHFVTGSVEDIYRVARQGYFVEQYQGLAKDSSEFLHTEKFILVDGSGHIRGIYNGTLPAEVERIVADMDILLNR